MVKCLLCILLLFGSFISIPSDAFISPSSLPRRQLPLPRSQSSPSTRLYGIPKLFRWLTELYPLIVDSVGELILKKGTDYFYLDMNGIIHSCTHANHDSLITTSEEAMFERIFAYTDRLYKLVRPRKQMFLAVDGVAPRAKMNQQRSRRFRAAKEREALLAEYVAKFGELPKESSFDSNCITPGTEFMDRLGAAFKVWLAHKVQTDAAYQAPQLEFVFSGPDVPGEGEHKVMDHIRDLQQRQVFRRGERRHCMYGLDADLIMLSLVTHEPHFVLLREKADKRRRDILSLSPDDFDVLEISMLRRMLAAHFQELQRQHPRLFDLDRVVDDFVFMCFFVGNDFLPCLPHLDIADGSLNLMMRIYKASFARMGGYLTRKEHVHLPRLELFLGELARREPLYFEQRAVDDRDPLFASPQYAAHYCQAKLGLPARAPDAQEGQEGQEGPEREVVEAYVQGLLWVLHYYHKGPASWTWYYPHLYAPLASQLTRLPLLRPAYAQGRPFTPLLQLLSVLPPQSAGLLPRAYADTMVSAASPLAPFFPRDFAVDMNGKKNAWESVVRIPFLPEHALLAEVDAIDHRAALSAEERRRNLPGSEFRITVEEPRKPAAPSAAVPPAAVAAASAPASSSEAPSSLKKAMQRMYGDNWAKGSGASGAAKLAN